MSTTPLDDRGASLLSEAPTAGLFPARCVLPDDMTADEAFLDDLVVPVSEDQCAGAEIRDDNDERASRALEAVRCYATQCYAAESIVTILGDFLGDLRHLCDAVGLTWQDVLESGAMHHDAEIRGEL